MHDLLESLQAVLGDRYHLAGELGRGGMATVYRAVDVKHQREVAIKVMSPDLAGLLGRERFLREITIASRLNHTHIVPLYDSGGDGDVLYFVMPLVEGESLRDRLDRETQLPFDEALAIARDVADGLGYAHAQGVVHRDVKPENILLSGGRAMLTDFGIARAVADVEAERLTSKNIIPGTAPYVSPEQAGGSYLIDGRADLYALGCVLHEMLSGSPPFSGRTAQVILSQHISAPPPPLRSMRATASPEVERLVQRLLAKTPADRFATATKFMAAATDAATAQEHWRPSIPRPGLRLVGALAVLVTVVVGSWRLIAGRVPLDQHRVVVFPLQDRGGAPGLGSRVSFLIGAALEHTEPLRWTDGWILLDDRARSGPVSPALAARTARRVAARYYVDGDVVSSGESLTVQLRLHDLVSDSVVQETATGALRGDMVPIAVSLAQRAVTPLLAALVGPSRHVDVAYLEGRAPAAVAAWLEGEQAYRAARYRRALGFYARALGLDSTLSVAALKAAQVESWIGTAAAADSLARLALRHAEDLPPRNRLFAQGLVAYSTQDADAAVAAFRASLAIDSLWPEGWMALGDSYFHLLPSRPPLDSSGEDALQHAVRLDATFGPALFHLAEYTLRRGDIRAGAALVERFRRVSPDSGWTQQLDVELGCVRDGPQQGEWSRVARQAPLRLIEAARQLGAGAAHARCAEVASRALLDAPPDSVAPGIRFAAFKWLHHFAVASGDSRRAIALVDSGVQAIHPAAQGLYVLDAVNDLGGDEQAARVVASLDVALERASSQRLWYFGMWAAHRRQLERLDSIRTRLDAVAAAGNADDSLLANAIGARSLLLRGDTTGAIRRLRAVRAAPGDQAWGLWESGIAERLLLAQLLMARDEPREALGIAGTLDGAQTILSVLFLRPSLSVRIAAAERLGLGSTADSLRRRLRRLDDRASQ